MHSRRLLAFAGLLALAQTAAAQTYSTIAYESFDYPAGTGMHNAAGGTGWANAWWSGDPPNFSPIDHAITVAPGLDGVGNAAEDALPDMGSFRFPATLGFEHLLDQDGLFGADGTTIWLSFYSRRSPGGDDMFGGVSLNHQFVAEHIFLGAPNSWLEWGVHDDPWSVSGAGGNVVTTVTGSNVDQLTHLVYRFDFMAGQERLQLWLDPVVAHPDTPADIDVMVHDFRFNEIGFKSGNPINNMHGWLFDGILLETPVGGAGTAFCFGDGSAIQCPCANNSAAGSGAGCQNGSGTGAQILANGAASLGNDTLMLFASGATPNQPGLYFQGDNAIAGGSGVTFGDGLRCTGGGVVRLQVAVADSNGDSATTIAIGAAAGVVAGDVRRYQLWYRDPALTPCGSAFNLSNGLEVTWEL